MNLKRKAFSYVRFSTPEQIKGDSLRRQLELSQRYADEHDLQIDETLSLRDLGLSAFDSSNIDRGALGLFLEAVRAGKVKHGSVLLVESLDRLSRAGVSKALPIFMELIGAGITIVTLADGMTYSEQSVADNWTQLIISLTIMARAHEESATKSRRLSAVWAEKKLRAAEKVVTSQVPAWLSVTDGKIVVDEVKAKTIRDIFRLVRNGYGLNLLERKLNQEKVPVIGKRTDRWHHSYLIKLTHNRALIGEYQPMKGKVGNRRPSGDAVKGYYPAVLTETEFLATQKVLEDRRGKGGRKGKSVANIFSGLCRCGYCGGTMRYLDKGKPNWRYLVCTNAKVGVGCRYILWRYAEIENTLLKSLGHLDVAAILKDDSAQQAQDLLEAERAKLVTIKKAVRNLIAMAEVADDITDLQVRLAGLRTEEKVQQARVQDLEIKSGMPAFGKSQFERFQKLREALDQANGDGLAELRLRVSHELKRFVARIEMYPEGDFPWSYRMYDLGIRPNKESRFLSVIFKNGDGRVIRGDGRVLIEQGPKSEALAKNGSEISWSRRMVRREQRRHLVLKGHGTPSMEREKLLPGEIRMGTDLTACFHWKPDARRVAGDRFSAEPA